MRFSQGVSIRLCREHSVNPFDDLRGKAHEGCTYTADNDMK
jgi:hypothetical protein